MTVALKIVSSAELPDPPYPAETRVRGWRFELDYERLNQSDTWAIAPPDMRPWLLMLWLTAWQQAPAGSMAADDQIIAAKIGMEYRQFVAHKDILLRGWRAYSDGRLYHPVIVEQVLAYQEFNRKERERIAAWREKKRQEDDAVTRNKRVCNVGVRTPEPEPEPKDITQPSAESPKTPRVSVRAPPPYLEILNLWREILPELPQPHGVEHWTDARRAQIRNRWTNELPDLDSWRTLFTDIRRSRFLMGQADTGKHRPFRCDLFWITKPENLLKFSEGKYDG